MILQPGRNLREVRERLRLKYRDVEEASQRIATRHKNSEFAIGLSRLADIENKGTVPSVYRLFSLAVIYGLDYSTILSIYGISLDQMAVDIADIHLHVTRSIDVPAPVPAQTAAQRDRVLALPANLPASFEPRHTTFLSRQMQEWGRVPIQFVETLDFAHYRYAIVGADDWSMYPLIPPGSFVQIDETKKRIANSGWDNDFSRPIYFLLLHEGYRFGWCTERGGTLIVQPHSSAPVVAEVFRFPGEVEVLGQVIGVAMRLDRVKPRRKRSS
jgi:transcriptional regulator with XRE-family HTH domain